MESGLEMASLEYEFGLERLQNIVRQQAPELAAEFGLFQFRLLECLNAEQKYGESSNNTAEKNRVIEQLMLFTSEHFSLQFIELCRPGNLLKIHTQAHLKIEQITTTLDLWKEGTEVKTQKGLDGLHYIVHEPITVRWSADHSVCYQQAKAQQIGTTRIVWLKQVQVHRDTSASANWKAALEKEERLLETLEERQDQSFPRCLAFDQTGAITTLIQFATQGHSWKQMFGSSHHCLDARQIRTLLQSTISICTSLKLLHEKNLAHRMLQPEHILLLNNCRTVLQDTGLSTWKYEPGEGPELYRAPEQNVSNSHIAVPGTYTDTYQLGAILYHLITGERPTSNSPLISLRTWNNALSPEMDSVLQQAIEPQIKKRWTKITDFSAAIKRALYRGE